MTGGVQGLHVQPAHSLWGHPLRPDVPATPDHVPAAGPLLSRAFPKGRVGGRAQERWAQGRWAQESWGAGGWGKVDHNGQLSPPTGAVWTRLQKAEASRAARRREHNAPVVLCFLPSLPVVGRPRHLCGNRGLRALPGWPSLSPFCASLWWKQYGTPSFSPSGQGV